MATEQEDAAIAALWPEKWANVNSSKPGASKRRCRLRAQYREHMAFLAFRERNPDAKCSTCKHFSKMPWDNKRMQCELGEGGGWYQEAKPDGVCIQWTPVQPTETNHD